MAEKRMFSNRVIESTDFLDLPHATQNLYIHLSMHADDDGIVNNAKMIVRMTNCRPKDYKNLVDNGYIIELSDKLCVIKHWKINNYLRADRYTPTIYREALKQLALIDKEYILKADCDGIQVGIPIGDTNGIPSIDKRSIKERSEEKDQEELSLIYDEFCEKLSTAYPQNRFDKNEAYQYWKRRVIDFEEMSYQDASNKIGRAVWNYLKSFESEEDLKFVPKLSNLLGKDYETYVLPLIEEKTSND